jgi:hypothetical protein
MRSGRRAPEARSRCPLRVLEYQRHRSDVDVRCCPGRRWAFRALERNVARQPSLLKDALGGGAGGPPMPSSPLGVLVRVLAALSINSPSLTGTRLHTENVRCASQLDDRNSRSINELIVSAIRDRTQPYSGGVCPSGGEYHICATPIVPPAPGR